MRTVTPKELINTFVTFYQVFFDRSDTKDTVQRINQGDCGTAALSIGSVAESMGYSVGYWDNDNHAFLSINGTIYDTAHPDGTTVDHLNTVHSSDRANEVDGMDIFDAYLYIDAAGCSLFKMFSDYYSVEVPEAVLKVTNNISDYDDPEWIATHVDRLKTYLENQK